MVEFLEYRPAVSLVYTDYSFMDDRGRIVGKCTAEPPQREKEYIGLPDKFAVLALSQIRNAQNQPRPPKPCRLWFFELIHNLIF